MKRLSGLAVLSILTALALMSPAAAQTSDDFHDPFLAMLAMVPDYEDNRIQLWYTDFAAIAEAWNLSDVTYQDVLSDSERENLWLRVMSSTDWIGFWNADFSTVIFEMQPTLGFTLLNVHQALTAGQSPAEAHILQGDFDVEAIRAALTGRDFVRHDIGGFEVWCHPDGCDQGQRQDSENREPGNIFGGVFGRKEPIAISPEFLLDSPSDYTMLLLIGARVGEWPTFADVPEYRALAETVTAQGTLLQLQMVNPDLIRTWDFVNMALRPEPLEDARESIQNHFGELPHYQLFAFAHIWRDGAYLTQIILVYEDATTAQTAVNELYNRIANGTSLTEMNGSTYQDLLGAHGEILPPTVYESADFAAAILTVQGVSSDDPLEVSYAYRVLDNMIARRDLYFLGTDITLPPE